MNVGMFGAEYNDFKNMDSVFDKIQDESDKVILREFYNRMGARDNEEIHNLFILLMLSSNVLQNTNARLIQFEASFDNQVIEQLAAIEIIYKGFSESLVKQLNAVLADKMREVGEISHQLTMSANEHIKLLATHENSLMLAMQKHEDVLSRANEIVLALSDVKKLVKEQTKDIIGKAASEILPVIFKKMTTEYLKQHTIAVNNIWAKARVLRDLAVWSGAVFCGGGLLLVVYRLLQ